MKQVNIALTDEQYNKLRGISYETKAKMTAILRRLIDDMDQTTQQSVNDHGGAVSIVAVPVVSVPVVSVAEFISAVTSRETGRASMTLVVEWMKTHGIVKE